MEEKKITEIRGPENLVGDVGKTVHKIGKIFVERKELKFILYAIFIGSAALILPKVSIASTLVAAEKELETRTAGDLFCYLKSFGSSRAWVQYFRTNKTSPEFTYYAGKVSENLKPLKPLIFTTLGIGLGFSGSKLYHQAKLELEMVECYTENSMLVGRIHEMIKLLKNNISTEKPF